MSNDDRKTAPESPVPLHPLVGLEGGEDIQRLRDIGWKFEFDPENKIVWAVHPKMDTFIVCEIIMDSSHSGDFAVFIADALNRASTPNNAGQLQERSQ